MYYATFLFTAKQQRLLAALLLKPDHDFTISELVERAEGGTSSVQDYLRTLASNGVITVTQKRGSKLYRINAHHPLFPELHSIAVKTFGIAEPIAQALRPLTTSIKRAFIFGSFARGEARHDSDIDLMIVGTARTGQIASALHPVEEALGREIHTNIYDPEEWDKVVGADIMVKAIAEGPKIELAVAEATTV